MAIETGFLYPLIILLGISVSISVLLSALKIRILPPFALEIIAGIALGSLLRNFFHNNGYDAVVDHIYVVGFTLIMFLSGYDVNLECMRDREKTSASHVNVKRISLILLALVYVFALVVSFLFIAYFQNIVTGILLLTITLSSSFAGIIAPMIHVERMHLTGWGTLMITFSLISEMISIIALTVVMIILNVTFDNLWSYVVVFGVFLLLSIGLKLRRGRRVEEGTVFLKTRMVILALAISVLMSEFAGGEYVLGAFLLGFFLKAIGVNEHKIKPLEHIGYGLFIPMFFIVVGSHIHIKYFLEDPMLILLVFALFLCFIIVKLPLLYLLKWYGIKTVTSTIFVSACTLVVAITAHHIGVDAGAFTHQFGEALILASILTTIVAPIVFKINFPKTFLLIRAREKGITYGKHC